MNSWLLSRRTIPTTHLHQIAWLVVAFSVGIVQGQRPSPARLYSEGPIAFREFRGTPPNNGGLDAQTTTHLKYDYRYRTSTRDGVTRITLTKMTFRAEFLPDKSWTKRPDDLVLLRHEQGHFDITEVLQRKAVIEWQDLIGTLSLRARSAAEAKKEFDQLMRRKMEPYLERLKRVQKQYDAETNHGRSVDGQRKWDQLLARLLKQPGGAMPLVPESPRRRDSDRHPEQKNPACSRVSCGSYSN